MTTVAGYSLLAIVSAWAVIEAAQMRSGWKFRLIANPVFTSLGKYSYGLYVLHMFFAPAYVALFGWKKLIALTGSYNAAIVIHLVLAIACSWGIAWLSYHLMEKHFLRLKVFFDYSRTTVPAPQTAPAPAAQPRPLHPNAIAISPRQAMRQAA
jgi:peptidoglycan/LPS O-acetylase OafA/YrhL